MSDLKTYVYEDFDAFLTAFQNDLDISPEEVLSDPDQVVYEYKDRLHSQGEDVSILDGPDIQDVLQKVLDEYQSFHEVTDQDIKEVIKNKRRLATGRSLWWDKHIGDFETHGLAYSLFLEGELAEHMGIDDEETDFQAARRIMEIAGKRHEETDYDRLLEQGHSKEDAREIIRDQMRK